MQNYSYENDFDLHEKETACRTHFHMKGFALRLALKQRHKRTRKWPIEHHPFRVTHRAHEFTVNTFTPPAKRTNEFSNQTCVFIRPTCLRFSLNKKIEATLTRDIHWVSAFTNQGVNSHGKHRHQPFQKLAQIFVGLQLKIFKNVRAQKFPRTDFFKTFTAGRK